MSSACCWVNVDVEKDERENCSLWDSTNEGSGSGGTVSQHYLLGASFQEGP